MDPVNVSVEDAYKALNLSKTTFYSLLKKGRLRVVKAGRRTLVPVSEIQAFNSRQLADMKHLGGGR